MTDLDTFSAIVADPLVMALIGDNNPLSRERAEAWVKKSLALEAEGKPHTYAVWLRTTLIGFAGFTTNKTEQVELIYGLAKSQWGLGYGTHIGNALVYLAFNKFGLSALWATVDPKNASSIKILESLGMTKVEQRVDEFGLPEILMRLDRPKAG